MKLHLGCGEKYIEGFIHVDLLEFDHIDYKTSIDKLYFAADDSIELIYASHLLEHVGRHEFKNVLAEWYRALKPSGVLRIAVPDFEALISHYRINHNLQEVLGLLIGGQKDEYDYHKMIFDEEFLKEALVNVGFKDVYKYDWRETEHNDLDDFSQAYLPHMDKEKGMLMSLNMEAVK